MTIEASQKLLAEAEKNIAQNLAEWSRLSSEITRVGIVSTRWYGEIIQNLKSSAEDFLGRVELNKNKIDHVEVSGSWELPLVLREYIQQKNPSFVIVLGCVVKGETPHFDILCSTVTNALMNLQFETRTPLGFGLLTVNSVEQAVARSNKGAEAAEAALRSWISLKKLSEK
ncbi:MAG: 6,7-dimethyl-8-ribityllumazine synthase [bacterium]